MSFAKFFLSVSLTLVTLLFMSMVQPSAPLCAAVSKQQAEAARKELQRLSKEERRVHADLAAAEDAIKKFQARVSKADSAVADVEKAEAQVGKQLAALEKKKNESLRHLSNLAREIWPVQVRRDVLHGRTLPAWDEADREFVWMSKTYSRIQDALENVQNQERAITTALEEKRALASKARSQLAAVNKDKDALLAQKLKFNKQLAEIRKRKVSQEEELKELLAALDEMNYKVRLEEESKGKATTAKLPFKQLKGKLPWPATGSVKVGYNPGSKPPKRGLGVSLQDGEPVRAISWGRVVHNEVLRGFGRVVILLHGDDYYSLYAFLASSDVSKGQQVAQGEMIGRAGYYPAIKGPGVYFELRFRQKPINPRQWLVARK